MKKIATLLFATGLMYTATFAQAPIPNASFENWTSGQPDQWGTSDGVLIQIGQADPGTAELETTPANVYAGNSSMKLTNKHVTTPIGARDIPGVTSLGNITLNVQTFTPETTGYPYTDRPDSIRFAAKYASGSGGTDTGNVAITLTRWTPNGPVVIARTVTQVTDNAAFTVFTKKINYNSTLAPDTLFIQAIATSSVANMVIESQMWVDDFSFIGLDTAFKAYVNPRGHITACAGDTVFLNADPNLNDTYQWYNGATLITGAAQPRLNALASGNYYVVVNHNSTDYTSDTVNVYFNPSPSVTYTVDALHDTVCSGSAVVTLTGGSPANGFYAGNAVTNGHFNPSSASAGLNPVTYTFTDSAGCSASAVQNIFVTTCTGISTVAAEMPVSIYPNPAQQSVLLSFINETVDVEITDLNGRVVYTQKEATNQATVNCAEFAKGVYVIKLTNQYQLVVRRFTKQ